MVILESVTFTVLARGLRYYVGASNREAKEQAMSSMGQTVREGQREACGGSYRVRCGIARVSQKLKTSLACINCTGYDFPPSREPQRG